MAKPKTGQRTQAQITNRITEIDPSGKNPGLIYTILSQVGISEPQKGTYLFYREMLKDPTVALSYAAYIARPLSSTRVWRSKKAPAGAKNTIQDSLERQMDQIIRGMTDAVAMGWAPAEKVWVSEKGFLSIEQIRWLMPDYTTIKQEKSGNYVGLLADNGKTELPAENTLVYTFDKRYDNMYGRPLLENARKIVHTLWQTQEKANVFLQRAACPIPVLMCPPGVNPITGRPYIEEAIAMLENLQKGGGFAKEMELIDHWEDAVRMGVDWSDVQSWNLTLHEAGDHSQGILEIMKHYEALVARSLLQTERSILQGEHGTLAEAGVHADIALTMSELLLQEIYNHLNKYLIDDILEYNYGVEARGTVWVEPTPLLDTDRAILEKIMLMLINPGTADWASQVLDLQNLFDRLGIKLKKQNPEPIKKTEAPAGGIQPRDTNMTEVPQSALGGENNTGEQQNG